MTKIVAETLVLVQGVPMDASLQPPHHDLQGAFVRSGQRIVVDMDLARPIARDMVRRARANAFAANDAATIQAMQRNDGAALEAARAKGDALRAAPQDPRIDAAKTPDDLLNAVDAIITEMGQ